MLRKSRAVITVSRTTKASICEQYGIDERRVFVVPNRAPNPDIFYPIAGPIAGEAQFLLAVGAAFAHKNIQELVQNWALWKGHYKLIITSCRGKQAHVLGNLIRKLNLQNDVELRGYVPQDELVRLYQTCSALVAPSLWEGFGITPLEALACGRPVIVSDIPAHREVVADAGIYVIPGNVDSWKDAFTTLKDARRVEELLVKGGARLAEYEPSTICTKLVQAMVAVEPSLCLLDPASHSTGGDCRSASSGALGG